MTHRMVLGYARTACPDGAAAAVSSQKQAIADYCDERDLDLAQVYSDVAGGFSRRPGLETLTWDATADAGRWRGLVTGVVVTRWDRLGRSLSDTLRLVAQWSALGMPLHVIEPGIEPGNPTSDAVLRVLDSMVEPELRLIHERTNEVLDQRLIAVRGGKVQ